MMKQPKAFIFDLDGVITDTAEYHYQAWKRLADEIGIYIDRQFNEELKGIGRMESLEKILALKPELEKLSIDEKENLAAKKNKYYKELLKSLAPADILPGILPLIQEIRLRGMKIALGSASKNAQRVLEQLELTNYFDYIVDAAKVSKGKPHPETFLTAADALGVPYDFCIGIEDAPSGVTAVNEAGMFSVGVGSKEALSHSDYRVNQTDELNFDRIIEAYGLVSVGK